MQLTKQTDYSLRILMYLGVHRERLCTIKQICETYNLSTGHIMKLVHELGKRGYIETIRGRSGGIRLAAEPKDLNIGEIVRFTEKNLELVECFQAEGSDCPLTKFCVLSDALQRALDNFFSTLDEYSLQDLIRTPTQLREALGVKLSA